MGNTLCALAETYLGVGMVAGIVIGMFIGVAASAASGPFRPRPPKYPD